MGIALRKLISYYKFADGFKLFTFVEIVYLNTVMCKFVSLQKKKAEPSRLIPRKHTARLELLTAVNRQSWNSRVASPKFWRTKDFDFRQVTVFCLGNCLSKHKMTKYVRNFWGHGPWSTPLLRLCYETTFYQDKLFSVRFRQNIEFCRNQQILRNDVFRCSGRYVHSKHTALNAFSNNPST